MTTVGEYHLAAKKKHKKEMEEGEAFGFLR
jgi:hypothetical protein